MTAETVFQFHRIQNDTFGNPRYVIEYDTLGSNYDQVAKIANMIGGRKYRGKAFRGGIVFQSYNLDHEARAIAEVFGIQSYTVVCD